VNVGNNEVEKMQDDFNVYSDGGWILMF